MSRKSKLLNQEAVNWLDDWADLREPTPCLLHMSCAHMQYSREGEDHLYRRNTFAELYPDHQVLRDLELQQLVEDLRQTSVEQGRSTPLPQPEMAALPDLFQMLDQCTGNVWLDVGEISLVEGGGYPEWSRENIEWLAGEWRRARPVFDGVLFLLNWKTRVPRPLRKSFRPSATL
jgi:hypothetical protein